MGRLAVSLEEKALPHVRVVCADAREIPIESLVDETMAYKLVANLPYYAASPIIRRFLESRHKPEVMVVMVQREVAQTMTAKQGKMGLLSVATQVYGRPRVVCHVPPRAFRPAPKVWSSVVRIDVYDAPAVPFDSAQGFFEVVRAGFSAPRKQIRNSLANGLVIPSTRSESVLVEAGNRPLAPRPDAHDRRVGAAPRGLAHQRQPVVRLEIPAYAKVNFTLEVLGRRGDGYHEIASIMQTVSLHDTVTVDPAEEITLSPALPGVAVEDNLAYRAAVLLAERSGTGQEASIGLDKAIPLASGLGGGSSDAAAVLVGLNRLWGLGMSADDLAGLGAEVGSDVPFFIRGGTAMVSGRGERVRTLPPVDQGWLVLVCPEIPLADKTAAMYSRVTPAHYTGGMLTRKLEARIRGGGDVPAEFLYNAFDEIVRETYSGLEEYWGALGSLGAQEIHVAGSGPSLYAPVSRRERGTAIALLLSRTPGLECAFGVDRAA